jgi:hypothetical protein
MPRKWRGVAALTGGLPSPELPEQLPHDPPRDLNTSELLNIAHNSSNYHTAAPTSNASVQSIQPVRRYHLQPYARCKHGCLC